jgi:hypothetical protein
MSGNLILDFYGKPVKPVHEICPDVCERAYQTPGGEQWNCPYHFGVNQSSAIVDGEIMCKHFKRKKVD